MQMLIILFVYFIINTTVFYVLLIPRELDIFV